MRDPATEPPPAQQIACPVCHAEPGQECINTATGKPGPIIHGGRRATRENQAGGAS